MKMRKRQFRIGELAYYLKVEKFVIRFWEKEFTIQTYRSEGGQRFYHDKDVEKFLLIKELLYQKGYTIAGAKKELKERSKRKNQPEVAPVEEQPKIIASQKTTLDQEIIDKQETKAQLEQQIIDLQQKLLKLREFLSKHSNEQLTQPHTPGQSQSERRKKVTYVQ